MAAEFVGYNGKPGAPPNERYCWDAEVIVSPPQNYDEWYAQVRGWYRAENMQGHYDWNVRPIGDTDYVVYYFTDRDTAFLFKLTYCHGL